MIRHLRRELTPEESADLEDWLNESEKNRQFFEDINNTPELMADVRLYGEEKHIDLRDAWEKMKAMGWEGQQREEDPGKYHQATSDPDAIRHVAWWKKWPTYVAAASILLLFSLIGYKWFSGRDNEMEKPVVTQNVNNDIAPGQFKAKLTLSDNKVIVLDSATDKILLEQAGIRAINKDGLLVYEQTGNSKKVLYNTLTTARGQTYATLLSDGTKIWLNSASSIRYPITFSSEDRTVEITGEVYFEVAPSIAKRANGKEGKQPFIVKAPGMEIEVLGTHFNVKSYNDEDVVRTTLVEGKVKVHSEGNNSQATLIPGEQAQLNKKSQVLSKTKDVDVDAEVAWRFGYFNFSNTDFETLMRQLQRWYDVEVVYQGEVPDVQFFGEIPRAFNLSQVLNALQRPGVHFKVVDKKIIVLP